MELPVGYAHIPTEQQDLTAQRDGLHVLGVGDDRISVDHDRHEPGPAGGAVALEDIAVLVHDGAAGVGGSVANALPAARESRTGTA